MDKIVVLFIIIITAMTILAIAAIIIPAIYTSRAKVLFRKKMIQKCKSGHIYDEESILSLIKSINREYGIDYPVEYYLEDFLGIIGTLEEFDTSYFSDETNNLIKKILWEQRSEKPFIGVAEEEQRLLININNATNTKDVETIKYNLHELGSVLTTKNRIYTRSENINKWSVPLAIIGIIMTLFFGYLSLQGVNYDKIKEINTNAIEEVIARKDSIR